MAHRERTITGRTHAQTDVGDAAAIAAAFDAGSCDVAINAAGHTAVDKAESEPAAALRINGEATGIARRGMRASAASALFHISTDYVFDGTKRTPYAESDPPAPLGVYGASKLAGERAVAERLDRHIILRTSWVFSATGANFVKTMLRLAAAGRDIRVVQGSDRRADAGSRYRLKAIAQILSHV